MKTAIAAIAAIAVVFLAASADAQVFNFTLINFDDANYDVYSYEECHYFMQWTAQDPSDSASVTFYNAKDPYGQHRVEVDIDAADGITAVNSRWNTGDPELGISFWVAKAWEEAYTYEIYIYNDEGYMDCFPPRT